MNMASASCAKCFVDKQNKQQQQHDIPIHTYVCNMPPYECLNVDRKRCEGLSDTAVAFASSIKGQSLQAYCSPVGHLGLKHSWTAAHPEHIRKWLLSIPSFRYKTCGTALYPSHICHSAMTAS